jgi:hypothetical protein
MSEMFFQPQMSGNYYAGQLGEGNNNNRNNPPYWWDGVIALISQGFNTWGGATTGSQVVSSGGRIQAITNPTPTGGGAGYPPPGYPPPGYPPPGSVGGGVGSGLDGALSWGTQNPLLVGGIAIGVYLLMKEPPRGRR